MKQSGANNAEWTPTAQDLETAPDEFNACHI